MARNVLIGRDLLMALIDQSSSQENSRIATWFGDRHKAGAIRGVSVAVPTLSELEASVRQSHRGSSLQQDLDRLKVTLSLQNKILSIDIGVGFKLKGLLVVANTQGMGVNIKNISAFALLDIAVASEHGLTYIAKKTSDLVNLCGTNNGCPIVDPWGGDNI